MDLEDSVMQSIAIAMNCLSLRSVSFYGCRMSKEGVAVLGELWHCDDFLHATHIAFEECENLPAEESVHKHKKLSCSFNSIISKFSPLPHQSTNVPAIEHVSFRSTPLCSNSKVLLAMSLPTLKKLLSLDLSGTGEWIGKTAFLLGQCVSALLNVTTWRFDRVDLCKNMPDSGETQQKPVANSHMLLLGLRMQLQSEFNSIMFQEDWTYLYHKNELFRSALKHLSFSHSCSTSGEGSMALTSILNCFPNLQSVDLSYSVISHSCAPRVFNLINIRCPQLRKIDFSGCSGQDPCNFMHFTQLLISNPQYVVNSISRHLTRNSRPQISVFHNQCRLGAQASDNIVLAVQ
jgi:hypothetical protein